MTMNVFGIVGSPRKGGNTEILVKEALRTIEEEGLETELITLWDKTIKHCDGCRICKRIKKCHIVDDDVQPIFDKMVKADGIILASPFYFGSATPQIKALIDRVGYLGMSIGRPFERKIGGPIVVARRAGHNFTIAQLAYFFYIMGMIVPGSSYWNIAFGREKGEVRKDKEALDVIQKFAANIAWLIKKLNG